MLLSVILDLQSGRLGGLRVFIIQGVMGVARIRQKLGMGTPILGAPILAHGGQVRGTSQGELANL